MTSNGYPHDKSDPIVQSDVAYSYVIPRPSRHLDAVLREIDNALYDYDIHALRLEIDTAPWKG